MVDYSDSVLIGAPDGDVMTDTDVTLTSDTVNHEAGDSLMEMDDGPLTAEDLSWDSFVPDCQHKPPLGQTYSMYTCADTDSCSEEKTGSLTPSSISYDSSYANPNWPPRGIHTDMTHQHSLRRSCSLSSLDLQCKSSLEPQYTITHSVSTTTIRLPNLWYDRTTSRKPFIMYMDSRYKSFEKCRNWISKYHLSHVDQFKDTADDFYADVASLKAALFSSSESSLTSVSSSSSLSLEVYLTCDSSPYGSCWGDSDTTSSDDEDSITVALNAAGFKYAYHVATPMLPDTLTTGRPASRLQRIPGGRSSVCRQDG